MHATYLDIDNSMHIRIHAYLVLCIYHVSPHRSYRHKVSPAKALYPMYTMYHHVSPAKALESQGRLAVSKQPSGVQPLG